MTLAFRAPVAAGQAAALRPQTRRTTGQVLRAAALGASAGPAVFGSQFFDTPPVPPAPPDTTGMIIMFCGR